MKGNAMTLLRTDVALTALLLSFTWGCSGGGDLGPEDGYGGSSPVAGAS